MERFHTPSSSLRKNFQHFRSAKKIRLGTRQAMNILIQHDLF